MNLANQPLAQALQSLLLRLPVCADLGLATLSAFLQPSTIHSLLKSLDFSHFGQFLSTMSLCLQQMVDFLGDEGVQVPTYYLDLKKLQRPSEDESMRIAILFLVVHLHTDKKQQLVHALLQLDEQSKVAIKQQLSMFLEQGQNCRERLLLRRIKQLQEGVQQLQLREQLILEENMRLKQDLRKYSQQARSLQAYNSQLINDKKRLSITLDQTEESLQATKQEYYQTLIRMSRQEPKNLKTTESCSSFSSIRKCESRQSLKKSSITGMKQQTKRLLISQAVWVKQLRKSNKLLKGMLKDKENINPKAAKV